MGWWSVAVYLLACSLAKAKLGGGANRGSSERQCMSSWVKITCPPAKGGGGSPRLDVGVRLGFCHFRSTMSGFEGHGCMSSVLTKCKWLICISSCHTSIGFFLGYCRANRYMARWFNTWSTKYYTHFPWLSQISCGVLAL